MRRLIVGLSLGACGGGGGASTETQDPPDDSPPDDTTLGTYAENYRQLETLVRAMTPPGTTPGEIARIFPLIQTLIERGEAANYGPHVLHDRLPGAGDHPAHLLFNMAIEDVFQFDLLGTPPLPAQ